MGKDSLVLTLTAGTMPMSLVHVRWTADVMPNLIALGDAWERSHGELGWRGIEPERVMPWYFATHDGTICHGYGVRTDARALLLLAAGSGRSVAMVERDERRKWRYLGRAPVGDGHGDDSARAGRRGALLGSSIVVSVALCAYFEADSSDLWI